MGIQNVCQTEFYYCFSTSCTACICISIYICTYIYAQNHFICVRLIKFEYWWYELSVHNEHVHAGKPARFHFESFQLNLVEWIWFGIIPAIHTHTHAQTGFYEVFYVVYQYDTVATATAAAVTVEIQRTDPHTPRL